MGDPLTTPPLAPQDGGETPGLCSQLLARIEDAGLNASAPPQQRLLGGWVLRLSPGKAKRARCVNALGVGQLPLDELLQRAQAAFEARGLPFIVRITPFTQPSTLDGELEARGFVRFDDTQVMIRTALSVPLLPPLPAGCRLELPGPAAFADAVGGLRGSPLAQRQAHADRLHSAPVSCVGMLLRRDGELLACGQIALEDDLVGLYDVFTAPAGRRQGLAGLLCRHLLATACRRGARTAYLQVEADNGPARRVYRRLGFVDGYAYHYRSPGPIVA
ncbi:GNAT family N-acetyltransferase [Methylibium sp.]|uniref:GNAT family N-acetyltransferase n=1 Tax=Methylibium sp. TaxID=2067992 RepID=UPI003D13FE26